MLPLERDTDRDTHSVTDSHMYTGAISVKWLRFGSENRAEVLQKGDVFISNEEPQEASTAPSFPHDTGLLPFHRPFPASGHCLHLRRLKALHCPGAEPEAEATEVRKAVTCRWTTRRKKKTTRCPSNGRLTSFNKGGTLVPFHEILDDRLITRKRVKRMRRNER